MTKLITTNIGRLRLIALAEGISLLILVFIAVPLKYASHDPSLVRTMGPVHGALFLLFVMNAVSVAIQQKWKADTTIKVLLSCILPAGTFFADHFILRPAYRADLLQMKEKV